MERKISVIRIEVENKTRTVYSFEAFAEAYSLELAERLYINQLNREKVKETSDNFQLF